jgi:hypothetical protein
MTTHLDDILRQSALLRQVSDQIRFAFYSRYEGALAKFRQAAVGANRPLVVENDQFPTGREIT